jgi:hypothetical protein
MGAPFLDFFAKLQERQALVAAPSGQQLQTGGASAAAIAAAAAAPTSRPAPRRQEDDVNMEREVAGKYLCFLELLFVFRSFIHIVV